MISFLGVQNGAGDAEPRAGGDPLPTILTPGGINLRYVNCPAAPFLNSDVQNPC